MMAWKHDLSMAHSLVCVTAEKEGIQREHEIWVILLQVWNWRTEEGYIFFYLSRLFTTFTRQYIGTVEYFTKIVAYIQDQLQASFIALLHHEYFHICFQKILQIYISKENIH